MQTIRKTLELPLSADEAFALFTERLDTWWPVESHSISAYQNARPLSVILEPKMNGQIIETLTDGSKAIWGHVTEWQPPLHLAIDWYVGRSPEDATQVTVTFERKENGSRLVLTHDGFERTGEEALQLHESYTSGWNLVLEQFLAAPASIDASA